MLMKESDFEDFQSLFGTYKAYYMPIYSKGNYKWELYVKLESTDLSSITRIKVGK